MEIDNKYLAGNPDKRWKISRQEYFRGSSAQNVCSWKEIKEKREKIQSYTWYCGVEVHKVHIIWALYGISSGGAAEGPILRCQNSPESLVELFGVLNRFLIHRFLMETTGIFHFSIAWMLADTFSSADIVVMNSHLVHRHIASTRKTDKSDAQKLAMIARYDELLRYSFVPSKELTALRELTRTRENYVRITTQIKNRIKKQLSMYGFHVQFQYTSKGFLNFLIAFLKYDLSLGEFLEKCLRLGIYSHQIRQYDLIEYSEIKFPDVARRTLIFEFHSLAIHISEVKLIEQMIVEKVKDMPEIKEQLEYIAGFPGLGYLSKISLLAEIGAVKRFPSSGFLLVYSGIAPAGGTSGVKNFTDIEEKIVKKDRPLRKCNKVLKRILVRAAQTVMRGVNETNISEDIYRYASKFDSKAKGYFKCAFKVAAKIGRKLFYCLEHRTPYNPRHESVERNVHVKLSRNVKSRRMKKDFYEQNRILKKEIGVIYLYLEDLGVKEEVLNQIRQIVAGGIKIKDVDKKNGKNIVSGIV